ncbi:MAG: urease accessory protein UreD [Gammaproteobacteria bacterium]|nr:urease accessory protein UreD [Gammaproteobacteria bacterium]
MSCAEPALQGETAPAGWQAELALRLAHRDGRTRVVQRRHRGPLNLQRAFYPEGEVAHLYLLHPPGGVVGGDDLQIDIQVDAGGHAVVTTPAAGKLYRSDGRRARLRQTLKLEPAAVLEWLPQETIVYAGAEADSLTRVELQPGSRFIGWEMLCLGRPAAGEAFEHGDLRQRFEIWRQGQPLWLERARFIGGSAALAAAWGLHGRPLAATLVAVGSAHDLAPRIRNEVEVGPDEAFAVTQLDDVLVCRYLGVQAQRARQCLTRAWQLVRPALLGCEACVPRVWNT